MKRLLLLVILAAVGYFGYQAYKGKQTVAIPPAISNRMNISQTTTNSKDLFNVLGTATNNLVSRGETILNNATDGQAEPVINKAVNDLQDRVKQLPADEYKRVKYEFCKDVLPSPSPSPNH